MRTVVQRVTESRVIVGDQVIGEIGPGLCVFLGIGKADTEKTAADLAMKIANLRIFPDEQGKMNRSVIDVRGEVLLVSQFTLYGDCTRGNRPSFTDAAPPGQAEQIYSYFVQRLRDAGLKVATGQFQTSMNVFLVNDGPVTLILEI